MSSLLPCPQCDRHVLATEKACPFCGVSLRLVATPGAAAPSSRLGRAARFAFGAAVAGTLVLTGCGDDDGGTDSGTVSDGGGGSDGGGDVDAGGDTDGGAGDDGGMMALYGGPPDAGDDGGGPAPAYGAAPADGGA